MEEYKVFRDGLDELQEALQGVGPGAGTYRFKQMAIELSDRLDLVHAHPNYSSISLEMSLVVSELRAGYFIEARGHIEMMYFYLDQDES